MALKIAHISDLHFSKILLSPSQFFSKRWIGNLNVILNRRKIHLNPRPFEFLNYLKDKNYTHVFITGDFTTTSLNKEFALAQLYLDQLIAMGLSVFVIPGNHDCYLKKCEKQKTFYKYFEPYSPKSLSSLKKHRVSKEQLADHLWLVSLDTTIACPVYLSQGLYSLEQDIKLGNILDSIPSEDHIILLNHYPLLQHESKRRSLKGAHLLQNTLKSYPNVIAYLHGHTHKNTIADLRKQGYPIILESGSLSHKSHSYYNSIEIKDSLFEVSAYHYKQTNLWSKVKTLRTQI